MNLSNLININTFTVLGTLLMGAVSIAVFFKRGASAASIESNEILRSLIGDQKQEIDKLRVRQHEVENSMTAVQLELDHLKTQRDYLEKLIHGALMDFFAKEPKLVKTLKSSLAKSAKRIDEEGGQL